MKTQRLIFLLAALSIILGNFVQLILISSGVTHVADDVKQPLFWILLNQVFLFGLLAYVAEAVPGSFQRPSRPRPPGNG